MDIPYFFFNQLISRYLKRGGYVFILLVVPSLLYGKDSLDRAKRAYLLRNNTQSIYYARQSLLESFNDEALYFLGLNYLKLGDYRKARDLFRKVIENFETSPFYQVSLVKFADTYFLENKWDRAEKLYNHILRESLALDYKPLIYLRLAQISAKIGKWGKKKEYLKIISTRYPHTIEKKYAQILQKRGDFFTIQVGAFASKRNALQIMRDLKSKYSVYLVEEREKNLIFYKVRVGRFGDKEAASRVYRSLVEEGYAAQIYP